MDSKGSTLSSFLAEVIPSVSHAALRESVLPALIDACSDISKALRVSHQVSLAGTSNAFGDDQLNVDVAAENILRRSIASCPAIVTASSEEDPVEKPTRAATAQAAGQGDEQYTVAFDPLDGSSIIAPNWTVGTIIGIWEGSSALHQSPALKQVVSILGVFGPRTTALVAVRIPGSQGVCFELGLQENGSLDCQVLRPEVRFAEEPIKTRYFAPANLRAAAESEQYMTLVNDFVRRKYTLRYSGGLVPDVVHALVKGHGLYVSPVTIQSKAKLRRLYELFPIALIMECVGGKALDPIDGRPILERALEETDERAGLICGTVADVDYSFGVLSG